MDDKLLDMTEYKLTSSTNANNQPSQFIVKDDYRRKIITGNPIFGAVGSIFRRTRT